MDREISNVDPHDLKPHPINRQVYGDQAPPPDLINRIEQGWSPTSILEALPDGTLISGHLRRFAAIQLKLATVPVIYRADLEGDMAAQVDELLGNNAGRVKSKEVICREWRLAWKTFKTDVGSVSGEKSRDVVGRRFGVSGVSLEHGIAVVTALDTGLLGVELADKVRTTLNERGIEPAWKLLRKAPPESTQSPFSDDSEGSEAEEVSVGIPPAKRATALLGVLGAIADRMPMFDGPRALEDLTAALPRETLDDRLAEVQNALNLLGLIEGEIRDRLDGENRLRGKSKKARQ
jgi:hypothetical protein